MEGRELEYERLWFLGRRRGLARKILVLRKFLRLEFGGNGGTSKTAIRYNETKIEMQFLFDYETNESHIGVLVSRRYLKPTDNERAQQILAENPIPIRNFYLEVVQSKARTKKTKKQKVKAIRSGTAGARKCPCLITKSVIDGRRRIELRAEIAKHRRHGNTNPCWMCGALKLNSNSTKYPGYCTQCVDAIENSGTVPHQFENQWQLRLPIVSSSHRRTTSPLEEPAGSWENMIRMIEDE